MLRSRLALSAFLQLVAMAPADLSHATATQTEPVYVSDVPPIVYHAATQTVVEAVDRAVGVNLPDRPWPLGLPFELVVRVTQDNPQLRPEGILEILEQHPMWDTRDGEVMIAAQRHYVLGVIRGVSGGVAHLSRHLRRTLAPLGDNREAFVEAVIGLWAYLGEQANRPM